MPSLRDLEQELEARKDDLNTCREMLRLDPNAEDAIETIPVLEVDIADLTAKIADKKAQRDAPPPPPPGDGDPPPPPKYDMSKHPKFRKQSPDPAPPPPPPPPEDHHAVLEVGNLVMAKYSQDKQWYQATVISKTGSSTDPVYSVTFKGYGNTETNKRKHEVRAIETKKRKADGTPAAAASSSSFSAAAPANASLDPTSPLKQTHNTNTGVISAAPHVDPTLVQRREPSKVSDGPTRLAPEPKKLKGNKALEKSKSSWNAWQQAGPKKTSSTGPKKPAKDSQFRTPDLPNAKVGFVGSGKPMQKDQARAKWNYGGGSSLDE